MEKKYWTPEEILNMDIPIEAMKEAAPELFEACILAEAFFAGWLKLSHPNGEAERMVIAQIEKAIRKVRMEEIMNSLDADQEIKVDQGNRTITITRGHQKSIYRHSIAKLPEENENEIDFFDDHKDSHIKTYCYGEYDEFTVEELYQAIKKRLNVET